MSNDIRMSNDKEAGMASWCRCFPYNPQSSSVSPRQFRACFPVCSSGGRIDILAFCPLIEIGVGTKASVFAVTKGSQVSPIVRFLDICWRHRSAQWPKITMCFSSITFERKELAQKFERYLVLLVDDVKICMIWPRKLKFKIWPQVTWPSWVKLGQHSWIRRSFDTSWRAKHKETMRASLSLFCTTLW